jgi:pyridoxal phosphate enzyme (YggS family)
MAEQVSARTQAMIATNLAMVRDEITAACQRANRQPDSVKLVAVSKKRPAQEIVAAFQEGVRHFGENRLEEAAAKIPEVDSLLPASSDIIWHMIGHVQSRKAKDIVQHFQVIHSLDSLKLANRYNQFAAEFGITSEVLLETNISGETAKAGIAANQWQHSRQQRQIIWEMVEAISHLSHIRLVGLMTMAPYEVDAEATRPIFAGLQELQDSLANDFPHVIWRELSMGMTNDYPIAIEEGATLVRIGRAIFGERPI